MSSLRTMPNRSNMRLHEAVLPSPVGGLNAASSYDNMQPNQAIQMDNFIPMASSVVLRRGYKPFAGKMPFVPKTIIPYHDLKGQNRFFAFGENEFLDITEKRDYNVFGIEYLEKLNAAKPDGVFSNAHINWVQFKDRLFLVNGIDMPKVYTPSATGEDFGVFKNMAFEGEGLMLEQLKNVFVSKQRLWFVEKNSMRVWYTKNAGEVQGELLSFDMSAVSPFSGYLVAGASWTQDGGEGMDDLTCFITSEGEVLVYKGIDPNDANNWTLKGVYKMAAPVGDRCFLKYHGDLILISKEGFIPLSKALPLQGASASLFSFSANVNSLVEEKASLYGSKPGWLALLYPKGGLAIFNTPNSRGYEQFVCNTSTGAWARFTGIKAHDFVLFNDRIYFASDEGVYLFDEGFSDNGAPINGKIEQAFSNFATPKTKRVTLLNPRIKASHPIALNIYMNTDFDSQKKPYETLLSDGVESPWNKLKWSTKKEVPSNEGTSSAKWATLSGMARSTWIATLATGTYFSLVLSTSTKGTPVTIYSTSVRFEKAL